MKRILFFIFFVIFFYTYAQTPDYNSCGWEYVGTASNAVIAIQQDNLDNIYLSGNDTSIPITYVDYLNCPMWIGVFYETLAGTYQCAGISVWDGSQMAVAAWGDDPFTIEQDGFLDGDTYIFGLCVDGYGAFYGIPDMSTEAPFSDLYYNNGFASLSSITFGPPVNSTSDFIASCWPLDLDINTNSKKLIKRIDMFGRSINQNIYKGVYFELFDNKSIVKKVRF